MNKLFRKHIDELVRAQIIDEATALRINQYFDTKKRLSVNLLIIIFAIIGAILIGSGTILIIAHNWDEFSLSTRSMFSFIPIVTGQILCFYTIIRKFDSIAWKEFSSILLFLVIGASRGLLYQIYHIEDNYSQFMFWWLLSSLPLIYIFKSRVTTLLYIACATSISVSNYGVFFYRGMFSYWLLLLLWLPYYIINLKKEQNKIMSLYTNLFLALSMIISLGHVTVRHYSILFPAYFFLLSVFILLNNFSIFRFSNSNYGAFDIAGTAGVYFMLFMFSFSDMWKENYLNELSIYHLSDDGTLIWIFGLLLLCIILLLFNLFKDRKNFLKMEYYAFLMFAILFFLIKQEIVSMLIINIYLAGISIEKIVTGVRKMKMRIMNLGLLLFSILLILRFFDTEMDFIYRGIAFIIIGIAFIAANYVMLKKKRISNEYK